MRAKINSIFDLFYLLNIHSLAQQSYGNAICLGPYYNFLVGQLINHCEWLGSNHSFLYLSRYCRNLGCPDTMFMYWYTKHILLMMPDSQISIVIVVCY